MDDSQSVVLASAVPPSDSVTQVYTLLFMLSNIYQGDPMGHKSLLCLLSVVRLHGRSFVTIIHCPIFGMTL